MNLAFRCVADVYIYSATLMDEGTASFRHTWPIGLSFYTFEYNKQKKRGKAAS